MPATGSPISKRTGTPTPWKTPSVTALTPNARAWRAADIPAGNGQSDARSLAKLYGIMAAGGGDLISSDGLAAATAERYRGPDVSMGLPTAFAAGFRLGDDTGAFGPSLKAFGHTGWGGAFAFADPDAGLGIAFVMNRMLGMGDDAITRHTRLIDSVYESL